MTIGWQTEREPVIRCSLAFKVALENSTAESICDLLRFTELRSAPKPASAGFILVLVMHQCV